MSTEDSDGGFKKHRLNQNTSDEKELLRTEANGSIFAGISTLFKIVLLIILKMFSSLIF